MRIIEELASKINELDRKVGNIMRAGQVVEIDHANGLVKLDIGDGVLSNWVSWQDQAGSIKTFNPPSIGQQMILMSPSGDPGQGWALPGGFSDNNPAPDSKGDTYKMTLGSCSILIDGSAIIIKAGSDEIKLSGGGITVTTPSFEGVQG